MSTTDVVDWPLARRVGRVVAGNGPPVSPWHRSRVRHDFRDFTRLSDELVREFTGLSPADAAPDPLVLDRNGWIAANIEGFGGLMRPLTEKLAGSVPARGFGRRVTAATLGVQMGVLLGYLSQKVLGQYDLMLASEGSGRVYYVGPNVIEAERRWNLSPRDFRLWIALHEVTHRTQFAGVPWLRGRVGGLIQRAVDALDLDPARIRRVIERGRDLLLAGPKAWRSADVMTLLMSDEQRAVVGDMQALMTVVEGHGNFVMNRIGAERIPSYAAMKRAIDQRRARAGTAERTFQRAIGMNLKYEQYALGERFMDAVAERGGLAAVRAVWQREENLPTLADLRDPDTWLERVVR